MSVEDLDPDFVSDDSDHEAEETVTDGDTDEANYQELVHQHNSLMSFDHIYTNNTIMDTEVGQVISSDHLFHHHFIISLEDISVKPQRRKMMFLNCISCSTRMRLS